MHLLDLRDQSLFDPFPEPAGRSRMAARERVLPVLPQKAAAVQELCKSHTFGDAGADVVAPCGLVAISVARWLADDAHATLDAAAQAGWAALETALAPLQQEDVLLPEISRTADEVLPLRETYAQRHPDEFSDDASRDSHLRGLIQPHEISAWLRSHCCDCPVAFMRNVQCGVSAAERVRFWSDLAALDADASLSAAERQWVREEGERDPSVDFLIETSTSGGNSGEEPGGFELQTVEEWLATSPRSGTPLIIDSWGHYSVLLYIVVAPNEQPMLVLLDSLSVSEGELPTPHGETLLSAVARLSASNDTAEVGDPPAGSDEAASARPEPEPEPEPEPSSCLFCKIVAGEVPATIIASDERTVTFMDINPANPGHALVVPRAHARDLLEIGADDLSAVALAAQRVPPPQNKSLVEIPDRDCHSNSRFVTHLSCLSFPEQVACQQVAALQAGGVNIINSCGADAWQDVFHFHVHVSQV